LSITHLVRVYSEILKKYIFLGLFSDLVSSTNFQVVEQDSVHESEMIWSIATLDLFDIA
jgi:hypothetical protein